MHAEIHLNFLPRTLNAANSVLLPFHDRDPKSPSGEPSISGPMSYEGRSLFSFVKKRHELQAGLSCDKSRKQLQACKQRRLDAAMVAVLSELDSIKVERRTPLKAFVSSQLALCLEVLQVLPLTPIGGLALLQSCLTGHEEIELASFECNTPFFSISIRSLSGGYMK